MLSYEKSVEIAQDINLNFIVLDQVRPYNLKQIHRVIPVYSATWLFKGQEIPIFIKEEFNERGREGFLSDEWNVLLTINKLRREIPTFIYGYAMGKIGGFDYSPTVLITEYFDKPILQDYLRNVSFKTALIIFLQIYLSVKYAYDKYHFIHGDLFTHNIIAYTSTIEEVIEYPIYDRPYKESITTKVIPIIFDFDRGSVSGGDTTKHKQDICSLLLSCFVNYPQQRTIMNWFGLPLRGPRGPDTLWAKQFAEIIIDRAPEEVISFVKLLLG